MKGKKTPVASKSAKVKQLVKLSRGKRILFNSILSIIPVIFLVLLEICLRVFNYGTDLTLFKKSVLYPNYYEVNNDIGKRYFTKFNATNPPNDIFLVQKPDTCYRIFVMGESTAEGFPYKSGTTFSRILNYRLQDAFPHKRIEVINTGMSAVNSYTLADLANEILEQKPDLILVYTGHNEYYGALGVGSVENGGNVRWLKRLHLKLVHLKTYQLVQKIVGRVAGAFSSGEVAQGTLMERIAKDKSIEYGSLIYKAGIKQFQDNMNEIIRKAKNAGVPIILSEQVCNIRDQKPFRSVKTTENPGADEIYQRAKQFELKGDYNDARANYYKAKDYDVIRYRAPEDINAVMIELGKKYSIPVVPMKIYFEKHSPNGLIGKNLMLEHLHPNIDGYFLMADAFFETMREEKLIASTWDTALIKSSEYYRRNWGFTPLDSLFGDLRIKQILAGWPFQPESVANVFKLTYKPKSYEDSVAFDCIKYENVHLEDKHIEMAKHYAHKGDNVAAFKEYYSLIKSYPHVTSLYWDAFNYIFAAEDYKKSLDLLLSVPDRDTNFYDAFYLGGVYMKLNMPEKAVESYKHAREVIKPNNNLYAVLVGLYNGYKALGNEEKEVQLLSQIKSMNPDFGVEKKIDTKEDEANKMIQEAVEFIKQGNEDKALELLNASSRVKETGLAYQMIGAIFFQRKDMKALIYYEKAYKFTPQDPNVLNNLFILYLMQKDLAKASKCLDEFKKVSTDYDKIQRLNGYLVNAKNPRR